MVKKPRQGMQRRLAALLSADVVGYSRLMDDNDVATVRTLSACRTIIAEIVASSGGRVVDSPGDNILAEFPSAVDAVKAAHVIQVRLGAANADLPDHRRMAFRIGVNLGDVLVEKGRIYGDGVNVAARIEALADPGGICVSGKVYDEVVRKLELRFVDRGEHRLKNIAGPVRVYALDSANPTQTMPSKSAVQGKPGTPDGSSAASSQRQRLAAVMFADMVGYSRRIEQDEIRSSTQVTRSVQLFKSLIGDYGGQVKNVAGDGILALFDSADKALRFGLQMRSEFHDQSVWADGDPIQFRIGLSLGEVIEEHGNVQGHCVNVAARLQQMAEPDNIVVTRAVRDAVRDQPGIALKPLGSPALKNMSGAIEVFAVVDAKTPKVEYAEAARPGPTPEPSRQPSVAVLALTNRSGDPANDHLSKGIVEDVIADLSRFRNLMVIARHSAFLFRLEETSPREIGRRLGARYLLGGSLHRSEKRIRIGIELIEAESEAVLWSDRFNIEMEELFDLQEEITGAVASRLAVQIDFAERRQESYYPRDMRAYGLVLRGRHLIPRFTKEANAHARRLFEEAIEIAPDYGRAYSSMSRTYNLDWRYSWSSEPNHSLDIAVDVARNAIQRDRFDATGFAELAYANLYKKRLDESVADYVRAIALNPNDADIIAQYADALVYAGQPSKSIELLGKAMRLNPCYPDQYLWDLADAYNALGRPADVIASVQRMQNPDEGRRLLAANYAHLGMLTEARAQASEVMRLHPGFTIGKWRDRPPYRDPAIIERYVEGLRKAGLPD